MVFPTILHYFLHFVFPLGIAWVFYRTTWKKTYLILLATMLVDVDHLFASPIFDPDRCSIGFHYLHTSYAIVGYVALLLFKNPYRIIGIGLLFHILTDYIDCQLM
ncbi:hypothetical protein GCM10009117_14440 [Gangjinia marincola]|uniref:Uncharacterized protein n=1 Tax=Gangjinia marincola TaxID=578463 RepID=A0ABP3XXI0_9FLAO